MCAYFSNGSSGDYYMSKYCMNCRHWKLDKDHDIEGCPVWDLHMIGDYDQCANTDIGKLWKKLLDILIPMKKDGVYPDECRMFLPIENPDIEGQMKMEFE